MRGSLIPAEPWAVAILRRGVRRPPDPRLD